MEEILELKNCLLHQEYDRAFSIKELISWTYTKNQREIIEAIDFKFPVRYY